MPEPTSSSVAAVISSVAALASSLAWPALVGIVLYGVYAKSDKITQNIAKFMEDKSSAKILISPSGGLAVEIVEKTALVSANAVIEGAKKSSTGALSETQITQVALSAQSAAASLAPNAFEPRKRLKVLWVDDHPENNIDLQIAFQTLGIIVICIDSNERIDQAFADADNFDVVITDMGRDDMGAGRRPADREAGLKTIEHLRANHHDTKVIVYASSWSAAHKDDSLRTPVVLITNYTEEVYRTVTDLAKKKAS